MVLQGSSGMLHVHTERPGAWDRTFDLSQMALLSAWQQQTAGMVIGPRMPCKRLCAADDIGPAALPHRTACAGVPGPAAPVSPGCPRLPGTYRASSTL